MSYWTGANVRGKLDFWTLFKYENINIFFFILLFFEEGCLLHKEEEENTSRVFFMETRNKKTIWKT
jgi:hypothetical protein